MPLMQSAPGAITTLDGREMLYFAGTGYLGLQGDPRVIEAACDAVRKYGLHTATSRPGFGENPVTREVEELAARFFGADESFYYATGYAGASILMQSVAAMFSTIFVDALSHFAVRDGAMLSQQQVVPFVHGDGEHLRDMIRQHAKPGLPVLVMCDGVSPVLGDIAPVAEYLSIIDEHGPGSLMIDDAHGIGVLGSNGRGTLEWISEQSGNLITINGSGYREGAQGSLLCATLSKAVGGYGGIIPGPATFISEIKAKSSWFSGASAPPAPVAGATAAALGIIMNEPQRRQQLHANVKRLKDGLRSLGLNVNDSPVPIICLQLDDMANMERIQQALMAKDIAIAFIRSYTGVGEAGALRIAVFATHTTAMIDQLVDAMRQIL